MMNIKNAVDRFLGWRLPKDFAPDHYIKFDAAEAKRLHDRTGGNSWPVGTNLLTAEQATAMFEHCLQDEHLSAPAANGPGEAARNLIDRAVKILWQAVPETREPLDSASYNPISAWVADAQAHLKESTPQPGMVTVPRETLERLRLTHHCCEDSWYSCPKHEDGCSDGQQDTCNCGADSHNAIIDAALRSGGRET